MPLRDQLNARKIDLSKFDSLSQYFIIFLLFIGFGLFFGVNGVTNALLLGSWQLFFDVLPLFLALALVISITMLVLNRIRKVLLHSFLEHIEQRPKLLFYQRISHASLLGFLRLYYVPLFTAFLLFPTYKTLPADIKPIVLGLFSTSVTLDLILLLFGFSMFLRLSNKQIVLYSLEYLAKTPNENLRTLSNSRILEFFSKYVVDNCHELFLSHWKFSQQINLWPEFNVIFLGLLCGNEKEREDTRIFLGKLVESINSGEDSESYRRIAESLNGFKTEMKSLSELEDKTMLKGKSAIRKPFLKKIEEYAPWITIFLSILAIIVSILQGVVK